MMITIFDWIMTIGLIALVVIYLIITIKFPKGHQEVLFSKITGTIIDLIEKRQKSIEDRKDYAYTLFLNGIKELESKNDGHNN